jgi:hypothetical protein
MSSSVTTTSSVTTNGVRNTVMTRGLLLGIILTLVASATYLTWNDLLWSPFDPAARQINLWPKDRDLEGKGVVIGDFSYYLDGARSILEFDIAKKFNDKSLPILPQARPISNDDMPGYAKYALALYPHSSFKFGYSLTAAAITGAMPQGIFIRDIGRMAVTNFFLSVLVVLLIYLSLARLEPTPWPGLLAAAFVAFDFSFVYNGFRYMSHTTAGLFYFFLAFYLFSAREVSWRRYFIIAVLLGFASLSSSHIYIPIAVFGAGSFLWLVWGKGVRDWLRYGIAGLAGFTIWYAYIFGVEWLFNFHALGLPTWLDQMKSYSATVDALIADWPVSVRQIWDLRVFNAFLPLIAVLLAAGWAWALWRPSKAPPEPLPPVPGHSKIWMLWAALIISWAVEAVYSQPVSRSMTPNLLLLDILLGYWGGRLIARRPRLGATIGAVMISLVVANFALLTRVSIIGSTKIDRSLLYPWQRPEGSAFIIDVLPSVGSLADKYFSKQGKVLLDGSELSYVHETIPEFVRSLDEAQKNSGVRYKWVFFDPIDVVYQYSTTRQFWPKFTPLPANVTNPQLYSRDYRLIDQIFAARRDGKLAPGEVRAVPKQVYDFLMWDQENSYPLYYLGGARQFMGNLAMADINFRAVYYISVDALRRVAASE